MDNPLTDNKTWHALITTWHQSNHWQTGVTFALCRYQKESAAALKEVLLRDMRPKLLVFYSKGRGTHQPGIQYLNSEHMLANIASVCLFVILSVVTYRHTGLDLEIGYQSLSLHSLWSTLIGTNNSRPQINSGILTDSNNSHNWTLYIDIIVPYYNSQ